MRQTLGPVPVVDPTACVVSCDLGPHTEIGPRCELRETVFGAYSYVAGDAEIIYARIGKFVSIASHTRINPGNHPMARDAQHHFSYRASAYGLGDDYAVCVGNPGRVIRFRFSEPVRAALKRIAWWDWTHDSLGAALDDFRNLSIERFCEKYDN